MQNIGQVQPNGSKFTLSSCHINISGDFEAIGIKKKLSFWEFTTISSIQINLNFLRSEAFFLSAKKVEDSFHAMRWSRLCKLQTDERQA